MIWNNADSIKRLQKQKKDKIYEIKEIKEKNIRSKLQNRYWHGVVCKTISDWSWDSTIWVHYMLKEMFKIETTTDLSTDEFAFMCKSVIELFKTNYNVRIKLPREDEDLKNLEKYLF